MQWNSATDYRSSLLKLAKKAKVEEDWEMGCLYYGTWLEHQLNNLIHLWIMRKSGTDCFAETLIKESGVRGKLLRLHLCITGRIVPEKQLNRLTALAQRRNQFVHYKWTMRDLDLDDDEHYKRAVNGADALVDFLYRFERKYFFNNRKRLPKLNPTISKK